MSEGGGVDFKHLHAVSRRILGQCGTEMSVAYFRVGDAVEVVVGIGPAGRIGRVEGVDGSDVHVRLADGFVRTFFDFQIEIAHPLVSNLAPALLSQCKPRATTYF